MRAPALRLTAAIFTVVLFAASCGEDDEIAADDAAISDMADSSEPAESDVHDHDGDTAAMETDDHMHSEPVEFEGAAVPTISIDVVSDPVGGINVFVETTNYEIAPRAASTEHVEGEGHFHVYVDGVKMARFYNTEIHIPGVPEGEIDVMVELSANDHRPYSVGGEPIMAMRTFTVPVHEHDEHDHSDVASVEWEGTAPALTIEVAADPKMGHNVFLGVGGFTLSAEHASGDHVAGEGHLHLYANGQKLGRLYGTATHVPVLPDGDVELTVAAYTNDHRPYVVDGMPLEAVVTVAVAT